MRPAGSEIMTYEEIQQRYPDEWVLVEVTRHHSDYRKKAGRLIAHSPNRDELRGPRARARAQRPEAVLSEFYTGELVPENVVVIL